MDCTRPALSPMLRVTGSASCAAEFFLSFQKAAIANMTKRAQSGSQRKKTLRLNALKKRQQKHAKLFEAVERRRRLETSRLAAARGRLRSNGLSSSTLERRRQEYVEIPKAAPSSPLSRAILGTIAVAFLLPLFVALSSNFLARPTNVVSRIYSPRPKPNVVSRISSSRPKPNVVSQIYSRPPNVVSRISSSRPKPNVVSRFIRHEHQMSCREFIRHEHQMSCRDHVR